MNIKTKIKIKPSSLSSPTFQELLLWGCEVLQKEKMASARLDAEILLSHVLGITRSYLLAHLDQSIPAESVKQFQELIHRRSQAEPIAYLTGIKEFWSLPFEVSADVLIPRPETEVLIETCLCLFPAKKKPLSILDMGTGSGILAIILAMEYPSASVIAIDISPQALLVAQKNAKKFSVCNQIYFDQQEMRELCLAAPVEPFDLIISNPPYISTLNIAKLANDIRYYEPLMALNGGVDGLDFYRQISLSAPNFLKPEGWVIVEIGEDQSLAVEEIFKKAGLVQISTIRDYAGLNRVVVAQRAS